MGKKKNCRITCTIEVNAYEGWKHEKYTCHNNINKHRGDWVQIQHPLRDGGRWGGMRMGEPRGSIWMYVKLLSKYFCTLEVFYFKMNVKNAFILIYINGTILQ